MGDFEFDKYTFSSQLSEIEKYLGYIKGNEVVEAYADQLHDAYKDDHDDKAVIFISRCPDESCKAVIPLKMAYPDDIEGEIFEALHDAWATGTAWAAGIADYCDSLSAQITEPDVPAMREAISQLHSDVVTKLSEVADVDWQLGGRHLQWDGEAGIAFEKLTNAYSHRINLWGQYAGNATLGLALATVIIAGHQYSIGKYVDSVADGAKKMAQTWPDCKYGSIDAPAWVADATSIGKSVLSIFNVDKATKAIGKIAEAVNIIDTIAPEHTDIDFSAETAEELYTQLTTQLYDKNLLPMQQAHDELAAGKGSDEIDLSGDLDAETFASADIRAALESKTGEQWYLPDPGTGSLNTENDPYPGS